MQLSHMASLTFRWMLLRWVDVLFPDGHDVDDVAGMADSPSDRRLDDNAYHDIDVIMRKLREGHRPRALRAVLPRRRIRPERDHPLRHGRRVGAHVPGPSQPVSPPHTNVTPAKAAARAA